MALLIERGALQGDDGSRAVGLAVKNKHPEAAAFLLERGAVAPADVEVPPPAK
jgi:hypothetical protein